MISAVADYRYGYDHLDNLTFMERVHKPGAPNEVYLYDTLNPLTGVWYGADATEPAAITDSERVQSYTLDPLGNRLTVDDDSTTVHYLPNNGQQLTNPMHRYEQVDGTRLDYDLTGNLLTGGRNTYGYDVFNRQISMIGLDSTAEYVYDALGRRVATIVDGVTTYYVYHAGYQVIEERNGSNQLLARYTYGAGIDEPLTMQRDSQTVYYHRDALGSITEVTDASGSLVERYEYDVYGAAQIFDTSGNPLTASAIENPYLFTGRRYDPESGNYYYRARIYSPTLGRFLQMDPLGYLDGLNLYVYVGNNPTNFVDALGLGPNRAQVGTIKDWVMWIVCAEAKQKNHTPEDRRKILEEIANQVLADQPKQKGKDISPPPGAQLEPWQDYDNRKTPYGRYVYSPQYGDDDPKSHYLDALHFFAAAYHASGWKGKNLTLFLGIGKELQQWVTGHQSAWSPEDLPSNKAGVEFGGNEIDFSKPIAPQLLNFLKVIDVWGDEKCEIPPDFQLEYVCKEYQYTPHPDIGSLPGYWNLPIKDTNISFSDVLYYQLFDPTGPLLPPFPFLGR